MDLDGEIIKIGGTGAYTSTDGIVLDASTSGVAKFYVGIASGNYIIFNDTADKLEIKSDNFSVASNGDVVMSGTVNASGGTFTGNVDIDGTLTAGTAKFGENVQSTHDGIWLDANNYWYDSGVIKAQTGTIGGFTLAAAYLVNQTGTTVNATSGLIKSTTATDVVMFAGADNTAASDANFQVKNNGEVTIHGSVYINKQSANAAGDQGFVMNGGDDGNMNMIMEGANPGIRLGAEDPLGTSKIRLARGSDGNGMYITWHTGDDTVGGAANGLTGQLYSWGMTNEPDNISRNFLMGHKNIYDRNTIFGEGTVSGGGTPGEYIFNFHSGSNNVEMNGHAEHIDYSLVVNGDIYATGNVIAYSDERRKKEIKTIQNPLDRVLQLRGVNYRWRTYDEMKPEHQHLSPADSVGSPHDQTDYETTQMGIIAQEAQDIIPEVVREDSKGALSINYGNITGILVEAIKEQQEQIDQLKRKVEELQ